MASLPVLSTIDFYDGGGRGVISSATARSVSSAASSEWTHSIQEHIRGQHDVNVSPVSLRELLPVNVVLNAQKSRIRGSATGVFTISGWETRFGNRNIRNLGNGGHYRHEFNIFGGAGRLPDIDALSRRKILLSRPVRQWQVFPSASFWHVSLIVCISMRETPLGVVVRIGNIKLSKCIEYFRAFPTDVGDA